MKRLSPYRREPLLCPLMNKSTLRLATQAVATINLKGSCNYDTQDVIDITLDDLQVGDEIILTIRSSEIENLQKEDDNKAKIAVEQLQLGTQRIK